MRKSRDFNEEYPKLRFLFDPRFCDGSVILCVYVVSNQCTLCIMSVASHLRCVCSTFSFCLSLSVLPFLPSLPGYFPTLMCCLCWEHVSLLLPLTPSSSHTGCLMAPSTTFCMKAPVSTLTLVMGLRTVCSVLLLTEIKVYLKCLMFVTYPAARLCRGPDAGGEVCSRHCLWNGLFTHA